MAREAVWFIIRLAGQAPCLGARSNVSRHMNTLSLAEIESLRGLVLQNARELLTEAELLFEHGKLARTYTLAHLSLEELAKLPILAACGVRLANGESIQWARLDATLRSHEQKLEGSSLRRPSRHRHRPYRQRDPGTPRVNVPRPALQQPEERQPLRRRLQGELYKPNGIFTAELAFKALTTSRNRLELFSSIEAITHGRIEKLAHRTSYMKLLKALGVGDDG